MSQEALEMAREKLGLNTKKDENFTKPDGPPDESLEGVMAWKEKITARRFKAAELDRMALESEDEARRRRGEQNQGHSRAESADCQERCCEQDTLALGQQGRLSLPMLNIMSSC